MASHHHHHRCHHQLPNAAAASSNCCCPHPTEPLIQAIVSQLLHQQQPGGCCQTPSLKTYRNRNFDPKNINFHHFQEENFLLSSLVSRIDALEASLHSFSSSSTASFSLRDMAARVIQTHFRAFLVRRSRTIRQLKGLALIKSSFSSLKSSVTTKRFFDFHVVSQKAMDLLLKLDSIQGSDPMIRDGKRSISKDLIKFLEFVDAFALKRYGVSTKAAKHVKFVGNSIKPQVLRTYGGDLKRDQVEQMNKLRVRIEKIRGLSRVFNCEDEDVELEGFHELIDDEEEEYPRVNKNGFLVKRHGVAQPKLKKSVTFAENGNAYRFIGNGCGKSNGSFSSGDGTLTDESVSADDDGHGIEVEEIPKETEDDDQTYSENGGPLQSGHEESKPGRSMRTEGGNETDGDRKLEDGQFVFSAPMPVKMESRTDLMKKRKGLKIDV